MRDRLWILGVLLFLVAVAVGVSWHEGWVRSPWTLRYAELASQLRDRGTVAVVGRVPFGMPRVEAPLVPSDGDARLRASLDGRDPHAVAAALTAAHDDGLLVRTDGSTGAPGSVRDTLASLRGASGLSATYLDETAAIYEVEAPIEISPDDAQRFIAVTRLILSGVAAPPERLFPEYARRARPVELALIVRDGHQPVLWRSTRSGSFARALLDVSFAVLDRWSSRQQEQYGRLRDALSTLSLTLAVFHDKGVLGARGDAFLRRAADARAWAVGYERLASWEYTLPPTPWSHAQDPVEALRTLTREHGVPSPGYLRPELTLYRFRAVQLLETTPNGAVTLYDP